MQGALKRAAIGDAYVAAGELFLEYGSSAATPVRHDISATARVSVPGEHQ
jgi:hypothetical protein